MTVTTRASLAFAAAAAFVGVLALGSATGALAQDGRQGSAARQDGPRQSGPGGRFGGPGGRGGPGGPMGPLGIPGPMMRELNLSDAQQQQVRAAVESHRDEVRALGERARAAHDALQAAITADSFDEATIRARSAEVAAADAEMAVMQARLFAEVRQVLTPEQQAQLKQRQSEMQQRRQERGPRPPQ